jgi:hypothetical protein
MGMNLAGFDASKVEPAGQGYEALPAGKYQAVIVHSESKRLSSCTARARRQSRETANI